MGVLLFFFNDTATTEIYTLSLHDALPISGARAAARKPDGRPRSCSNRQSDAIRPGCNSHEEDDRDTRACTLQRVRARSAECDRPGERQAGRSEEHTSELQSRSDLVCRLLL